MEVQWLLNRDPQIKGGDPSSKANLTLRAGDLLTASVLDVDNGRDALISIGQFKAYARLPLPVVSGQSIRIQVQQADKGLKMVMMPNRTGQPVSDGARGDPPQVIEQPPESRVGRTAGKENPALIPARGNDLPASHPSLDKSMLPAGGSRPSASVSPGSQNLQIRLFEPVSDRPFLSAHSHLLHPGESIEGRVTGFAKDGLLLVDFGKFKAFAKIDVPVREGQILPLTVEKSEQGITFSIGKKVPVNTAPQVSSLALDPNASSGVASQRGELKTLPPASPLQNAPSTGVLPDARTHGMQPSVPLSPPTAPEMIRFRDEIKQLIGHLNMPEKPLGESLPPTTQAALTHLQQLLRPVSTTGDITTLMARIVILSKIQVFILRSASRQQSSTRRIVRRR